MLTIGKIAKASGCKVQAIRYYEQIGLIHAAQRSEGNQRLYKQSDVDRLQFIRHARSLGFNIEMVKALLLLENHQEMSCEAVNNIAIEHLGLLKNRINKLQFIAQGLEKIIEQCPKKDIKSCKILETLREHTDCIDHQPVDL